MECIQDTNPHPPCWLDLNWKVTVMCKEETQEDVLCCAVLILSPEHFLTLSSLFCRVINVEAAPHARERRAPQLRRRTLSCRTMWTDTLINTHINTNKWCCGCYTLTNIIPTCLMEEKKLSLSALVNANSALLRISETLDGHKCLWMTQLKCTWSF